MENNPVLETERLRIFPLTADQLKKYILPDDSLALALNLTPSERFLSKELEQAFQNTIFPKVSDPSKNYLFSTLWTIVLKSENIMVGDLLFKGEPNELGEIEIGYGLQAPYRKQGIMGEAAGCLIKWAFTYPEVLAIVAETEASNLSSQKVLERNKFRQTGVIQNMLWWKLSKTTQQLFNVPV